MHFGKLRFLSKNKVLKIECFFFRLRLQKAAVQYVCGMSVFPFMMAHVTDVVWTQILTHLTTD